MLKQQSFLDFARRHLLILIPFFCKKKNKQTKKQKQTNKQKHIVFLDIQNSN